MTDKYFEITEIAGDEVSAEQVQRMTHRYLWAAAVCRGKDTVEAACGTGPGITYLASVAKSLEAGDFSEYMVQTCRNRLGDQVRLLRFDAQTMPYADSSKDVVILFEAIYYIPSATQFFRECQRVLRPGGRVLIATANKDLYDFNPSPNCTKYLGAIELANECRAAGLEPKLFGYVRTDALSGRQRILRPVKRLAVAMGWMPTTNGGKKWLKRLVFGKLIPLPADINPLSMPYSAPDRIADTEPDRTHKVLYCEAVKPSATSANFA